ncbi:lysozyme inhibitor LprI family protein [Cytobacillus sp. BC1816]|uniref:lysozyme inhibitor LprI family protein n=1 Tax=Cytobacillus sp. BC1816 TaxID=3440154 RepID=UPI003F519C02
MKKMFTILTLFIFLVGCNSETVSKKNDSDTESDDITVEESSESLTNNQKDQNTDLKENSSTVQTDSQDQKDSQQETKSKAEDKNVSKDTDKNIGNKGKYMDKLNDIEKAATEIRQKDDDTTLGMIESEEVILAKWDQALNEIYQVLEKQLSTTEMEKLRVEQRKWITYRDDTAKEAAKKFEGGTMESLEYTASQAGTTKEKSYDLVESYMK